MIKNLTRFALMRPVTTVLMLVAVLFFGLQAVFGSPMELTPEMNYPMMILFDTYPGASPEDITETVTKKLEDSVATLSGIENVYSYSMDNVALMMLQYEYGTNMDSAYLDLRKNMDMVASELPDDAEDPIIMEMDMNAMPVMQIMISGGTDGNLRTYVESEIIPELEKLSTVAEVSIAGGRDSYIRIELDEARMKQYNLTMNTLTQLIGAAEFTIPAGTTDYGDQSLNVSVSAEYRSVEAIKNIVLPLSTGEVIRLSDVATVYDKLEDADSIARYMGNDVVTISVSKQQSASAMEASKQVMREMEVLKKENERLDTRVIYDSRDTILETMQGVFQTLILAMVLAMLILLIFFGDIKASLIVGTSIPISVMISLVCMRAMGFTMNMISVGSLVLGVGMVVDNSIVVLDSCFRQKKLKNMSFYEAALDGAGYVAGSVAGSTATTCVVFLPLALLSGMSGMLFNQFGWTIVFCMVASLISAVTVVPMLFYFIHPTEKDSAPVTRIMESLEKGYRVMIRKVLPHKWLTIFAVVAMLIFSFMMAKNLGMELMAEVDEGQIGITIEMKPNEKLEDVTEVIKKVEAVVAADPNVEDYLASYGNSGVGMSLSSSSATVTAYLKDKGKGEGKRQMTIDEIISSWKPAMGAIPNATITMESASSMGMSSMNSSDLEADLTGTDLDTVRDTADAIVEGLRNEPYITKVHHNLENGAPLLRVKVDPVKAQAEGLTPAGIAGSLYQAMSGKEVMTFTVDTRDYTVRAEYPDDRFDSIDKVKGFLVSTPYGHEIPLSELAEISFEDSPTTLLRRNKRYYVQITGSYVEGYKDTASAKMTQYVKDFQKPLGVEQVSNVNDERMMEEMQKLAGALLTAVFLIFIVMAMQFESVKYSFMVMFTIPFSMIGAFFLLFMANCKLSMISMVGFLMMVGTVVNNGILYVDTATHLRGENMDLDTALAEAGAMRLRPIFMTTLTTIMAMIPMCLRYGRAGEYMQGLALVNVGGLIASTTLSLLLLPVLYRMMTKKKVREEDLLDID